MRDPRCKPVPPLWAEPIEAWCVSLAAAGRTPQTIRSRRDHVQRAARAVKGSPWRVEADRLIGWAGSQDWMPETRRSVYASLRSFYAWALDDGRTGTDPTVRLPRVKASAPRPRPAPEAAVLRALTAAPARERLIVRLAAEAGLRRSEIARVHARDLMPDLVGWSLEVHGKGRKTRTVPLTPSLAGEVLAACQRVNGWAFPGVIGGHLSEGHVGKIGSRMLPEGWSLHTLRHRFATSAYDATRDLLVVQELLGHSSPATTQRYVALGRDALRRAVEAVQAA